MVTQKIFLSGLTCEACVKLITRRFTKIAGVRAVNIASDGQAIVEVEQALDRAKYHEALMGLPYEIVSIH